MKMKFRPRIWVTIFFILVFSYGAYEAIEFPFANRFFPLLVSGIGLVLCLIQLYLDLKKSSKILKEELDDYVDIASNFSFPASVVRKRAVRFLSWYVSLLLGIWILGFKIAVPLFFIGFLRIDGKVRWPVTIILTSVSIYTIFFHFENLLGVYWPEPILGKWIHISWLF
jgi:hypothetical protein